MRKIGFYEKYVKRILDIILSLGAIIVLSPVLLIVALLVKYKLGSPIIFKQKRPGKNEQIFEMYKFRTMTNACDKEGNLLADESRLTSFGKKLRATSLDELPELFNILKGDMSVIGPRPLLIQYLPYYTKREQQRHSVRPGLTGYAQAHGRNALTWDERFEMDVLYTEHITFFNDLKILNATIKTVIKKEGINLENLKDFDVYRNKQNKIL